MVERIKEIILKEGLTSGSFADLIGVQRSSMSHILNGRNNPSLDFIVKTIQHIPTLNPEWLLTGIGNMYRSDNSVQPVFVPRDRSIFDHVPEKPAPVTEKPSPVPEKSAPMPEKPALVVEKTVSVPEPVSEQTSLHESKVIEKQIDTTKLSGRLVDKVLIFYNDRTYDEFSKTQKPEI